MPGISGQQAPTSASLDLQSKEDTDAAWPGFTGSFCCTVTLYPTPISAAPETRSDCWKYLDCACPLSDRIPLSLELTLAYNGLELLVMNRAEWLKTEISAFGNYRQEDEGPALGHRWL